MKLISLKNIILLITGVLFFPVIGIITFFLLLHIGTYYIETSLMLIGIITIVISIILSACLLLCFKKLSLKTNIYISSIVLVIFILFSIAVFIIYIAMKKFLKDDSIYTSFSPLTQAIDEYNYVNHKPPASLKILIPKYIAEIPKSRFINSLEYRPIKNGQWELKLYDLASQRLYIIRSDNEYSEKEKKQILKQYHGIWTVFKYNEKGIESTSE